MSCNPLSIGLMNTEKMLKWNSSSRPNKTRGLRSVKLRHYLEMTTVTSSYQIDQQLDRIVELAKDFNKKQRGISFSIEYSGLGSVRFIFVNQSVTRATTEYIQELCDKHNLSYSIIPLNGKLAITLS